MNIPDIYPLTPDRWEDFEQLFGPRGACGGCWCMWWKLRAKEFDTLKGDGNHSMQKEIVMSGEVPGLLAYVEGKPAGWIAVELREKYPRLANSRVMAPVDERPVWSITCFFIGKQYRGQGLSVALLRGAIEHVTSRSGTIVEGYPVSPKLGDIPPSAFLYTGLVSAFEAAGFVEVARRSETRPVMRYFIQGRSEK